MKAMRIRKFGSPEVILPEEIEIPAPGSGEVLIRVAAAGVGPWDAWVRSGRSVLPQPLPLTLGSDVSGVVEKLGPEVAAFEVGDAVFGVVNERFTGAYANYAAAKATMLAKKPAQIDFIRAASVPVIAVTAWQMLFDQAHVTAGHRVLVLGAAGNVGAMAVQLANSHGAEVFAAIWSDDSDRVLSLGARTVVDLRKEGFARVGEPVDIVIDAAGGDRQRHSIPMLKPGGILISSVSPPDQDLLHGSAAKGSFLLVDVNRACLEQVGRLFAQGTLKTNVGTVLPLADARVAHEMLDGFRQYARGKIVLNVEGERA